MFLYLAFLQTVNFQSLEILQEHGIAANDIQKLQNAGYHTVESVRESTWHDTGVLRDLMPFSFFYLAFRSRMRRFENYRMSKESQKQR